MALEMLHDVARVYGTDEQMDMPAVQTTTHARGRSRSRTRRGVVCWHCGRRGHIKQRCFCLMRQQRKQHMLHDLHMADATIAQVVLDATTASPCTLIFRDSCWI